MDSLRSAMWTAALASSALLAACGGGGSSDTSTGTTAGESPAAIARTDADTQPPTITLTSPANLSADLNGYFDVIANTSDDSSVAGVEFELDGALHGSIDTHAPFRTSINTAAHASGQHVIRARARDPSGNVSAWTAVTVKFGGDVRIPQGFTKNEGWVTGITAGTAFAQAPDGRVFVAEQTGKLRVVKNGVLLATPFATLSVDSAGERGVIGVALHPDFATNGWVYVYHTTTEGGTHNRISRYTANGDVASGLPTTVFNLPALSTATNHNGGAMHFGKDGKLYVGVGDNARGAPAQDKASLFGKMLRLNDDGSIPGDNPFYATSTGDARAVWAYGLRNPFTFAVRPGDGRIHINDVGENTWEEIDLGAAGANYGWPGSEGGSNLTAGITGPLFTYKHSAATPPGNGPGGFFIGNCIAGGAFYPATGPFPERYRGSYFFGDFVSHVIGRVDLAAGNGNAAYAFAKVTAEPVDMLASNDGALLVLTRGSITRISAP